MTTFENKCGILADVWLNYRYDEEFRDFVAYHDLGLPLAYCISEGIVDSTDLASNFINETFASLLVLFDIEDTGFDNLGDLLDYAQQ